jgi:hypothetical protein
MTGGASRYAPDSPRIGGMSLHIAAVLVAIQLTAPPVVPSKTLHAARDQTARILASAGVKLVWREHANLQLKIDGDELRGASADAMGLALLIPDLKHATVSWPAVVRAAGQMGVDSTTLLGAAMAHEIGHLLFGAAHTRSGIMSERLGPREMALAARGALVFEGR